MGDAESHDQDKDDAPDQEQSLYDRPGASPSPARMFAVASGLSQWTAAEKAWLAMHPKWIEKELSLRASLKHFNQEHKEIERQEGLDGSPKGFVNRLKPKDDKEPGSGEDTSPSR